ncbi:vascular endothelial growth factor receptor 1-like isoform X2 [Ornithodoros turicata]|uniref:vascular endothelial growth factor receptor 1-like isoform X2 n=1 Tax=Ornithodoros turicata TaxID=34597 RepID=UPI003138ECEB
MEWKRRKTFLLWWKCVGAYGVLTVLMYANPSLGISRYLPPKLDLVGPFIDVPVNSTIRIACFGGHPLEWETPDTGENVSQRSVIYTEQTEDDVRPYKSVLEIYNSDVMDMGFYYCVYNGTTDHNDLGNATSIYVFVNDDYYLFQPGKLFNEKHIIPVTHGRRVDIPCLPTHSKAEVNLYKVHYEEEYEAVALQPEYVEFDPRQGFIVYYPHSFYSGNFMCNGSVPGLNFEASSVTISLIFYGPTDVVPAVQILRSDSFHPVLNGSFSLNCTTRVSTSGLVTMSWEYPSKTLGKDDTRIVVEPAHRTEKLSLGQESVWVVSSRLTVNNVERVDEGVYTCLLADHTGGMYNRSLFVTVFESEQSAFVNLTTDLDPSQMLNVSEGRSLKIAVTVHAHPSFERVRFMWTKDGARLEEGGDVTMTSRKPQYIMEKTNAVFDDSGLYVLHARVENATSILTVMVDVKSKPIVTILNKTELYDRGLDYNLTCNVKGTPPLKVWWEWKKCEDPEACTDDGSFKRITRASALSVNHNVIHSPSRGIDSRERNLTLTVQASQSAYYRCVSENILGNAKDGTTFYVTDARNGFEIRVSNTDPVEEDRVKMSCLASNFRYVDLTWKWRPAADSDFTIISESTNSRKIENATSLFSHRLTLDFKSISLNDSGDYECFASVRGEPSRRHKNSTTLRVQEITAPKIAVSNLKNKKQQDVTFIELMCTANGVPQPVITWFKNGRPLNLSTFEQRQQGRWIIKRKVTPEDSGFYQCKANNRGGFVYDNITITAMSAMSAQGLSTGNIAVIVVAVFVVVLLIIMLYYYIKRFLQDRRSKKDTEILNKALFNKGQIEFFNPDLPLCEQAELLPYDPRWEFPKDRLKLGRTLGQGAFGRVVKAEAIGLGPNGEPLTVAVKMLKERADTSQQKALMAELKILIALGRHLNIVNILGAVTKNVAKGELMMIVEYCKFGNLRHYLLRHRERFVNQLNPLTGKLDPDTFFRPRMDSQATNPGSVWNPIYGRPRYIDLLHSPTSPDESNSFTFTQPDGDGDLNDSHALRDSSTEGSNLITSGSTLRDHGDYKDGVLTTRDLLCYAFQCARGMEYLASRKLIHRDLAARNVLLSKENVVKICDFGLAKDCYKYSNYVKKGDGLLPVKWTAIESIMDRVFTTKSDVWSYGVLLWEIFSLGGNPYPGVTIDESFYKKLKNGYRMEKPDYAPDDVYGVMRSCWELEPKDRPDFSTLVTKVGDLLEDGVRDYYVALNEPHLNENRSVKNNNDYLAMGIQRDSDYLVMKSDEDNYINTKTQDNASQYANINGIKNGGRVAPQAGEGTDRNDQVRYMNIDGISTLCLPGGLGEPASPPSPGHDTRSTRSDDPSELCATPPPAYNLVVNVDVNSGVI